MHALLLTTDLACSSKVAGAATRVNVPMTTAMSVATIVDQLEAGDVGVLLVDLTVPGMNLADLVPKWRAASTEPLRIIAFGPHVHEDKLAAATEAGCDQVMSRGEFHARVDTLLAGG